MYVVIKHYIYKWLSRKSNERNQCSTFQPFRLSDNVWSEYTMSPGGSNEINESVEYIQVRM